jgi:hypothetical protein
MLEYPSHMTVYLPDGLFEVKVIESFASSSIKPSPDMSDSPEQPLALRVNQDHIRLRVLLRLKSNDIPGPLLSRPFRVMSDFYEKVLDRECNWDVDYFHLGDVFNEVHTCDIVLDLNVGDLDQSLDNIPIMYFGVGYKDGIL